MRRGIVVALCISMLGFLFSGCGQQRLDMNEETNKKIEEVVKPVTVAVLPPGRSSPFHSQIAKGSQQEGEKNGWRVEVEAPENENDFSTQAAIMEKFISEKVNAISVNSIDDKAIGSVIKKANTLNIPIFVHNSQTPLPEGEVVQYIGYNQRNGGYACGEYAAKLLGGSGKVYILDGIQGFHQVERTGGFLDAIKKYSGITVVGEQSADWLRETAIEVTTEALKKDPDIRLIFADSDEMAIGASIAAIRLNKEIYTIGIDGNPVTLDEISKGSVTATLGVYPDRMGDQIIIQMKKLMAGEKICKYLETPAVVVDKNNLEDYKKGKLWTEPKEGRMELIPK